MCVLDLVESRLPGDKELRLTQASVLCQRIADRAATHLLAGRRRQQQRVGQKPSVRSLPRGAKTGSSKRCAMDQD